VSQDSTGSTELSFPALITTRAGLYTGLTLVVECIKTEVPVNRIQRLVLPCVFLGMAVFANAAPPPAPVPPPKPPILLPILPTPKLKAPEIDLAAGASALVLLTGTFIWIRSRRKR